MKKLKFATDAGKPEETIKTFLHAFYHDMHNENDKKAYTNLKRKTKKNGIKEMECISIGGGHYRGDHQPKEITLETKHLFNNQWNSQEFGRVFDYYREIFPNKNIKSGHWLEITDDMRTLRDNTYKCGYCGSEFYGAHNEGSFCPNCIDSEYLTEEYLHLLKVMPVSSDGKGRVVTDDEMKALKVAFVEEQTIAKSERAIKKQEKEFLRQVEDSDKNIESFKNKKLGYEWLFSNNISLLNLIYYDHKSVFSFGWRKELDHDTTQALRYALEEFPFKWEIKSKDLGVITSSD